MFIVFEFMIQKKAKTLPVFMFGETLFYAHVQTENLEVRLISLHVAVIHKIEM